MQLININFFPPPPGVKMQLIFEEDLDFIVEDVLRL